MENKENSGNREAANHKISIRFFDYREVCAVWDDAQSGFFRGRHRWRFDGK